MVEAGAVSALRDRIAALVGYESADRLLGAPADSEAPVPPLPPPHPDDDPPPPLAIPATRISRAAHRFPCGG